MEPGFPISSSASGLRRIPEAAADQHKLQWPHLMRNVSHTCPDSESSARLKVRWPSFHLTHLSSADKELFWLTATKEAEPLRRASAGTRFLAHLGLHCSVAALLEGIVLWIESSRICWSSANPCWCSCCKQFGRKYSLRLCSSKIAVVMEWNH